MSLARVLSATGLIIFAGVFATLSACGSQWIIEHTAGAVPGCIVEVQTDQPLVALTIDDGPDAADTPAILEVLASHQARATFFLITENIAGNEDLVRRLVREGHEIGNHLTRSESHVNLPLNEFESKLIEADEVLSQFADPVWIRTGGGRFDQKMVEIWQAHGYRCALGSVYPFDAWIPWTGYISWFVRSNAHPGSIIILHDGKKRGARTAGALDSILPELAEKGLRVVTLSELAAHEGG